MIAERFWPRVGSQETRAANLASELGDRGVEVTIVTARWRSEWPAEIYYHGVPVVRLLPAPGGRWTTWRWRRSIGSWLKRNADHLDVVLVWGMSHEARAAIEAIADRVPVVLVPERTSWYGDCFQQIRTSAGRRIEQACRRAAAYVSTSPAVRRELEAAGYARDRIRDVPQGVPLQVPRTVDAQTDARDMLADASSVLQLAARAPLVVSITRLAPDRGWELLLSAWSIVVRRKPGAQLWLAGETSQADAVLGRIDSLGLASSVSLLGKFDDVAQLLAAADLLVAAAPEGSSQALLEAMSTATPAVAIDLPNNRWLLGDETAGLLVPPADAESLAAAVVRLLDDVELAHRLGGAGRQRVEREFTMSAMADELFRVLDDVRAPSRSRA
jgi:glycosyltransferase involved in cell wall biosynthesis